MTREEKEQTGKYVLQMARLLEDGCYQQKMLLKAVHIIDEALEQEPTTKNDLALIHTEGLDEEIRCTMCTNYMKSDRGCDGSCVVNKDVYKAVMDAIEKRIQPTTKNDLGVDAVSRKAVINQIFYSTDNNGDVVLGSALRERIARLPSVTPQEPKTGHWISHREHCENLGVMPSGLGSYYWCSECDCGIDSKHFHRVYYNYCPNCGSDNRGNDNGNE